MSTDKQLPNNNVNDKGKGKMVEEPEANQHILAEKQDNGKEILIKGEEPKPNRDKRKAIILLDEDEADHDDASGDSKDPKTAAEEGGDDDDDSSPPIKESSPEPNHFGFIVNPVRERRKKGYACGYCEKRFITPQALGGHQNGHKWERTLKQRAQATTISMRRRPYSYGVPSLGPPSYQPFSGKQGVGINPVTQNFQPYPTPFGSDYAGLYKTFQNPGTGSGTLGIGKSAFQHPEQAWFNPGFRTQEIGDTSSTFQHPLSTSTSFNARSGTRSGAMEIGNGAIRHPQLAWLEPGIGTNDNNGGVGKISGLNRQVNEGKETQQGGTSTGFEFVLLPKTNDHQITGAQQVRRSEIDFGLVPKRNGENRETQQDETSKIDLNLKL